MDTLPQFYDLLAESDRWGLSQNDIRCPTQRMTIRVGRERDRQEVTVPIIRSFLFVRWSGSLEFANHLERAFPFIKIMRRNEGGYATCEEKEIEAIQPDPKLLEGSSVNKDQVQTIKEQFPQDSIVVIDKGPFQGLKGIVQNVNGSGEVKLDITESYGWQLSTLLVSAFVLQLVSEDALK